MKIKIGYFENGDHGVFKFYLDQEMITGRYYYREDDAILVEVKVGYDSSTHCIISKFISDHDFFFEDKLCV